MRNGVIPSVARDLGCGWLDGPSRPVLRVPRYARNDITLILLALLLSACATTRPADRVRAEFLHSWRAYERYAWGHDELRPLTRQPRDWYGESLLITPVDSLDALLLMATHPVAGAER